jgi:hypothetical protein
VSIEAARWLEPALWLLGVVLEAAIIGLLVQRRIARLLPVFFVYCCWNFISDLTSRMIQMRFGDQVYFRFFEIALSIDTVMLLSVLVELTWSVVRPYRASISRSFILKIAFGIIVLACIVWPFTGTGQLRLPHEWVLVFRIQQTSATLRILFFLALAGMSQLLAIGWRNRELQIATGLGFYSLMSLGAILVHMHHLSAERFHYIDNLVSASYACSLIYWVVSFTQQEAPRQKFTPRMQNLLLTVAGTAGASRLKLEEDRKSQQ